MRSQHSGGDEVIRPGHLSLADLRSISKSFTAVELDPSCWTAVEASSHTVQEIVEKGDPSYGINTGFGKLAKVQIPSDQLSQLQLNLVRSHAVGVGELLDDDLVRLILVLKIASLARGFSGIRREVIEALVEMHNAEVWPCIPCQGSVGASGDLAPLAHLVLPLLGEGEARYQGERLPAFEALQRAGLQPITLGPKEGLALLNGTQVSTAIALHGLFLSEQAFAAAIVSGALSVDAAKGSDEPFDPRIHEVRGHQTQVDVARLYRELLAGSE
ncbi:MAG: histidine ammonia-lyase, partial [Armatimonadetes bacterium Cent15-Ar3]